MAIDNPIATVAEDALDRRGIARSLASLILNAPEATSFRIGVFGGWGEGKTSVLRMMQSILEPEGIRCVWVFPWAARSTDEVAHAVLEAVLGAVAPKAGGGAAARKGVRAMRSGWPNVDDWRVQLASYAVRLAADRLGAKQDEKVLDGIRTGLGETRVVVFVDDLDRTRPELIPELLLTLREALDLPNLYYVMALSPAIVDQGLSSLHRGWSDQPQRFLEKIVEYPQYVTPSGPEQVSALVSTVLSGDDSIDRTALEAIVPHLGTNPRRIKLFIRFLQSMRGLLARFSPEEIDLPRLYVAVLMKLEFPEEAHRLSLDSAALQKIDYGAMSERLSRGRGAEGETLPEEAYAPEVGRERFLELAKALRKNSFRGSYALSEMMAFLEAPPEYTWREIDAVILAYNEAGEISKAQVLAGSIKLDDVVDARRARALFGMLVEGRNRLLGQAADADREGEVHRHVAEAQQVLGMLNDISISMGLIADGTLGASEWLALVKHLRKWAEWTRPGYYRPVRDEELAFLKATAERLPQSSRISIRNEVARTYAWREGRIARFDHAVDQILDAMTLDLIIAALDRFRTAGGVDVYWSDQTAAPAEKAVLFTLQGIRHRKLHAGLRSLAKEAASAESVQENFCTYFRMLAHGAFEPSSFSSEECKAILTDRTTITFVWRAAVARPLNLRTMGSLRAHRTRAIQDLRVEERLLPLPKWWRRMETYFTDKETAAVIAAGSEDGEPSEG